MLEAIISFLPTPGNGAIGALDWTPKERKKLALESHNYSCPVCGAIDGLIELPEDAGEVQEETIQKQVAQLHVHGLAEPPSNPLEQQEAVGKEDQQPGSDGPTTADLSPKEAQDPLAQTTAESSASPSSQLPAHQPPPVTAARPAAQPQLAQPHQAIAPPPRDLVDEILFYAMTVVGLTILYLLIRRFNRSAEGGHEL